MLMMSLRLCQVECYLNAFFKYLTSVALTDSSIGVVLIMALLLEGL